MSTRASGQQSGRQSGAHLPAVAMRPAGRSEANWRPAGRLPPKTVGSLVPKLTRKAFERFGFATATLLTDWAGIVGAELARYTAPERLRWPRQPDQPDSQDSHGGPKRQGATLSIRVDGGRAIDVQYRSSQLIERINAHFGYRAVAELRIIQAPVDGALDDVPRRASVPAKAPPRRMDTRETGAILAQIEDDALRAALERMQAGLGRTR